MYARLHGDALKLVNALGYDFDTLEFAVRDGIPYAIDFLNPAPDADLASVGRENFEWVLEHASRWLIERVQQGPEPPAQYRWQTFLAGRDPVTTPAAAPAPTSSRRPAAPRRPRTPRVPQAPRPASPEE
jgi:hypothetical protein